MRRVALLLFLCACPPPSSDDEAKAVARDLAMVDDAADDTMRVTANDTGLTNVETMVKTREKSLHEHVLALQSATLTPANSAALKSAYAKNVKTAHTVVDRINNAVPPESAATKARAKKVALQLCVITETPANTTDCAPFRE